jgi:hypothetical protein
MGTISAERNSAPGAPRAMPQPGAIDPLTSHENFS